MRIYSLVFAALLLFTVTSVNATAICAPGTICFCGTNISASGEYNVTSDLVGAFVSSAPQAGLACIRVSVSDVKINCNGHTLTNNVNGTTQGILVMSPTGSPVSNVTIQNCGGISNYTSGVDFENAVGSRASGIKAFNNTDGFRIQS